MSTAGDPTGTTVPFDRSTPWWLQQGFAPVTQEVESFALEVAGSIPTSLDGVYVRNGSNPATGTSSHWFFGDGMVHGVRVANGRALWYRNRYVRTPLYEARKGFGQAGPPGGTQTQSNVSVVHHAGHLLSSGEVGLPYELSAADLHTIGPYTFRGRLHTAFTAHPKIDPATRRLHFFGYGFTPPYLTYHVAEADGTLSHSEAVHVARPTMIHDFAITDRDVVFWELPVVFDMQGALQWIKDPNSGAMPFVWMPSHGARVGVMPLAGPASAMRWHDIDPCYVFHGVNAYRDGSNVVVDVCRLSSMFAPGQTFGGRETLRRWTIDTSTNGRVRDEVLVDHLPGELPTRDPRVVGRRHRYAYLVQTRTSAETVDMGGLVKHDFVTGRRESWDPGPDVHSGEWLFVPEPGAHGEDEGWLLAYVSDAATDRSELAIIDATAVSRGPVARIATPQRVPFGFHATWASA